MELGSQAWLDRCCEAINGSQEYLDAARGWTCRLGLAFLADGHPVHHALLRLRDGRCEAADHVGPEEFAGAPVQLSGDIQTWCAVLDGKLHPLKAFMLKRIRVDGDLLQVVKYANAARLLFESVAQVDVDVPTADVGDGSTAG